MLPANMLSRHGKILVQIEYLSVKLKSIQKRVLKIVFLDNSYDEALNSSGLESLEKRRLAISRRFILLH